MNVIPRLIVLVLFVLPVHGFAQSKMKFEGKDVVIGETLNYKASWGFFTIGSATTKIDKTVYRVGSDICFKIDITGQTNGIAKLFYVRDKWTS